MRLWPWRGERREDSFTDAVVAQIQANASGATTATASATAALEACAGLVGRAFASATVQAEDSVAGALEPSVLAMMGRALIRHGEYVCLIDTTGDGLRLLPAQTHDVIGQPDPRTWAYNVTLGGPSATVTHDKQPAAAVVHLRYAADPAKPWRGVGPLQAAALAGKLSAETVAALADESSGPRGNLLPIPVDGADATVDRLKADIRKAHGKALVVEGGDWGGAPSGGQADWQPRRLGANPPGALVSLAEHASREVFAACGVPAALFAATSSSAGREAYRQALFAVIAPLGRMVSFELSEKLGGPVLLGWDELGAADIASRARAFQSMVGAGMDPSKAAGLAGLMAADD